MDVVPAFIAVDGVKFPLSVGPQGVGLANDAAYPGLDALAYVVGYLIGRRAAAGGVPELEARTSISRPQALSASPVTERDLDELGGDVANWTRLAGEPPDLSDAYSVGTSFLTQGLVVPRRTLISLVERVGALHDAVVAHRIAPRIEGAPEVGPVNPPVERARATSDDADGDDADGSDADGSEPHQTAASAPGYAAGTGRGSSAPTRLSSDDRLRDIEAIAGQVDELDSLARQGNEPYSNVEHNAAATAGRQRLYIELEVAGLLAPELAEPARAALIRLGLVRLLGYLDAAQALGGYLVSPERAGRFAAEPIPIATEARVSLDWFRTPSGYRPAGVTEHQWLALCERNFASPVPPSSVGSRFVRLCGATHRLRYRPEVGPVPCLWRAELAV